MNKKLLDSDKDGCYPINKHIARFKQAGGDEGDLGEADKKLLMFGGKDFPINTHPLRTKDSGCGGGGGGCDDCLTPEDREKIDKLTISGDGSKYLADNGEYKTVSGGGAILYDTTGQNTDGAMTQKATTDALSKKVDIEPGKGLSSNDYTDSDKSKLAGIEAGAEKNVQSNWDEETTTSSAYIVNKPSIMSHADIDLIMEA